MGYGDGYPRHAPSGTPVLVNGTAAALAVGRVSMDMLAIDLGDQPDAAVGDPVVLWGEGLPVETVAGQRRHHRLRAALRHHRPRPCRAGGC